jgi:hypothetical protein
VPNACIMPMGYCIGDHHLFVINFSVKDIIRKHPLHNVRATSCHLNTRLPQVAMEYVQILEAKMIKHQLMLKGNQAYQQN